MAKEKKAPGEKKKHWWNYLGDAYRITKRTYSWLPWALIGAFVLGLAIGLIPAIVTGKWIQWILLGVAFALMFPMFLLLRLVRKASYSQLRGMAGASTAVLDNLGRGWNVKSEPVRVNARTQEMVFRALGRPGVVLVSEGTKSRAGRLLNDERKAIKRIAPSAPIHEIMVGEEEGQVDLAKLEKQIKKLKKQITSQEVAALSYRLEALNKNALPIPKGIDPYNARPNRRAMRGK
ncbi:DUF4191 domain-containing protein [Ancrocorticia populi]|uniref:DUF4191 domain-containing protein n=1 Tax=Ancrocorticia populi TaxID=2175228 RepID=A0A2V1K4E6_9ACTO|nr:DUF4191 domain-containing protein [Ancrocorticia populi]PWF24519.1 DUF4191 domain-containing protein [Ancrocorticia populi]